MDDRNARFARRRDLRNLRTPPYGLFLGYHGLSARPLVCRDMHLWTILVRGHASGMNLVDIPAQALMEGNTP